MVRAQSSISSRSSIFLEMLAAVLVVVLVVVFGVIVGMPGILSVGAETGAVGGADAAGAGP